MGKPPRDRFRAYIDEACRLQEEEVGMLRARMTFVGILGIAIIIFDLVSYALIHGRMYDTDSLIGVAAGLAICAGFIVTVRKLSGAKALKLSAFCFICVWLGLIAWGDIADATPYPGFVISYVMTLFTASLIIPWFPYEIIPILFVIAGVYTFHFYFTGNEDGYLSGLYLILMSFMICFLTRRYEMHEALKKFRLGQELKAKNKQMQAELELATRVHSRLIPHSVSTNLADIAVTYVPMYYMGGDYAKFQFEGRDRLVFIICDVTGHGVSAALLVNAFNSEFERLVRAGKQPGELLKEMNRFVSRDFADTNMYLTAFCGLLEYGQFSRKLIYSNYGHPPQYIYRSSSRRIEKISAQTSFLGLMSEDENIYQNEVPFNKEDSIVLFTDGVIEARNARNEEFGSGRLEDFIGCNNGLKAEEFNRELLGKLYAFSGNKLNDDVFILSIKTK
ncbi:MAG: PP2C family protein-serine/threonine phosphatase [Candidatus Omnitrophota bacterium]